MYNAFAASWMIELAEMVAIVVLGWTLLAAAAVDSPDGKSLKGRSLVLEMEAEIEVELDPQSEQEGTQSRKEEDLD
jgi:hypothetical protein